MTDRSRGWLIEIGQTLILTVVIFLVVQTFVAQPYEVLQVSMERTLEPGHHVLVDKLSPRWDEYSRGDIVVFRAPDEETDSVPFIKRVIGVPGDTVEIRQGSVIVNGQPLDESGYVYDDQPTQATGDTSRFTVEPGTLFVMGDHRMQSQDSRSFGPVPLANVLGRAVIRYWPIDQLGILDTPRYPDFQAATR